MKYVLFLPLLAPILAFATETYQEPTVSDAALDDAKVETYDEPTVSDVSLGDAKLESRGIDDGKHSDLKIQVWNDQRCSKASNTWIGKLYGKDETWPSGFRSYKLSRNLHPEEQIDFTTSVESYLAGAQGSNGEMRMNAGKHPKECEVWIKKTVEPKDRKGGECRPVPRSCQCVNLFKSGGATFASP